MADRVRETIGDESLENWKELGSGGFGCVYKASHKDWGFDVAIKLLHVGCGTLPTDLGREAGHMDSVAHQFVPKVYGMYQGIPPVPKLGYIKRQGIVMELMQRGSLLSLLKALSGPPPWALAFRLADQVAVAMNFLHSKKPPVVHSDLKPDNVLLDAYLDAKIADFGLSMVSTSVVNTSNKGDEGGTLFYTAPEAFEQDYRPVRSYDVYSYGMLLWTILTGNWEPYLAGVNHGVLKFRIIMGDRPDLRKIDQSKADGLDELVDLMERCWDKDPTKRPTFKGCTEVTGRVFSKHKKGIKAAVNETMTKLDSVNRQEECVRPPGHAAINATEDRPPTKPGPEADKPVLQTDKPVPQANKPGPEAAKPGPEADKPGPEAVKPGPEADKPGPEADKPGPEEDKPVLQTDKPVPQADEPVSQADKPGPEADKPVPQTDKPVPQADKPGPEADKPVPQTDKPVPQADKPGPEVDKPVPQTDKPVPQADKPGPEADKPVPHADKPVPQTDKPVPQADKPGPEADKPVLQTDKPVPQADKPGPEEDKPVLQTDKPVPQSDKPGPMQTDSPSTTGRGSTDPATTALLHPTTAPMCEPSGGGGEDEEQAGSPPVEAMIPLDVSHSAESRSRRTCLNHSCQLSLDVNTVSNDLILSEENRRVTYTVPAQPYPEHPHRFTYYIQVLSKESLCLSEPCYFEVKWRGRQVGVAVSYIDINRKEKDLSLFGFNDKSWSLWWSSDSGYGFTHNSTETNLSGPVVSTVRGRWGKVGEGVVGVYVDHRAGTLSFYHVDKNTDTQTLLYTVNTTFTQPLYAGIITVDTAEVCKIW